MSKRDYAQELEAASSAAHSVLYIEGAAETYPSGFYVIRTERQTWLVASEYEADLDGAEELLLVEGSVNDLDETQSCYLLACNEEDKVLLFDAIGENCLPHDIIWRG